MVPFPDVLRRVASLVCHQEPARGFHGLHGEALPLCARCTGLYAGFLLAVAGQLAVGRGRSRELPGRVVAAVSVLTIALFAADGVASRFGWRETGIGARSLLGLLGGCGIGVLLLPLFRLFLTPGPAPAPRRGFPPAAAALIPVLVAAMMPPPVLSLCWGWAGIAGLLLLYAMANLTASGMLLGAPARTPPRGAVLLLATALLAAETLILLAARAWGARAR